MAVELAPGFDNLDRRRLVSRVQKDHLDHQIFLDLLRTALREGVVGLSGSFGTAVGTAKGSPLAPLLANLYLHPLDDFITAGAALAEFREPRRRRPTAAYRRLAALPPAVVATALRRRSGAAQRQLGRQRAQQRRRAAEELAQRGQPAFAAGNLGSGLLHLRCGSELLLFVGGGRSAALELQRRLGRFLRGNLGLRLPPESFRLAPLRSGEATFQGWQLGQRPPGAKNSVPPLRPLLPTAALLAALQEEGLLLRRRSGALLPCSYRPALALESAPLVAYLAAVFGGLVAYYAVAANWGEVRPLLHYWGRYCAAMTLAHKTKGTVGQLFRRYGSELELRGGAGELLARWPQLTGRRPLPPGAPPLRHHLAQPLYPTPAALLRELLRGWRRWPLPAAPSPPAPSPPAPGPPAPGPPAAPDGPGGAAGAEPPAGAHRHSPKADPRPSAGSSPAAGGVPAAAGAKVPANPAPGRQRAAAER